MPPDEGDAARPLARRDVNFERGSDEVLERGARGSTVERRLWPIPVKTAPNEILADDCSSACRFRVVGPPRSILANSRDEGAPLRVRARRGSGAMAFVTRAPRKTGEIRVTTGEVRAVLRPRLVSPSRVAAR